MLNSNVQSRTPAIHKKSLSKEITKERTLTLKNTEYYIPIPVKLTLSGRAVYLNLKKILLNFNLLVCLCFSRYVTLLENTKTILVYIFLSKSFWIVRYLLYVSLLDVL